MPLALWLPDVDTLLQRPGAARARHLGADGPTWRVAVIALFGLGLASWLLGRHGSWIIALGLLLLFLRPWLDRARRFAWRSPYASATTALVLSGIGVMSVCAAAFAINASGFRRQIFTSAPPRWFLFATLATLFAPLVAVAFAERCEAWLTRGVRLRRLAQGAWASTALLVCAALTSGRAEFDARRYFAALPGVATVHGLSSLPREVRGDFDVHVTRFGDLSLRGVCQPLGRCNVLVTRGDTAGDLWQGTGFLVSSSDEIELRQDRARSLVLMRLRDGTVRACSARDGRRVDESSAVFSEHAGAPRPWMFGALFGLVVAGALLRRGRGSRSQWVCASARGGRVGLDDGRSLRVVPSLEIHGPVLVRDCPSPRGTYREDVEIDASQVIEGSPEKLAEAVHAAEATRDAVAFATLVLTAAPLWTAAAHGLVFG